MGDFHIKKIILPSGKSVEIVYFHAEEALPHETDGTVDAFASVEMTVMKNGTLTIIEAIVVNYEMDSNGDWIGA